MKVRLFLDSGAYSAFKRGGVIDRDQYIRFVQANQSVIDQHVSLDLIPGVEGVRERRPDKIEQSAQQSYQNHRAMVEAGLAPIPVFHFGENFKWLKQYLNDGEQWIALSVKRNPYTAKKWLDEVFSVVNNWPTVKVHGLGLTSLPLLKGYPFGSVDSGTWLKQSSKGQIPVPRFSDGKPNYTIKHRIVSVTRQSYARSNHLKGLTDFKRAWLDQFLQEVGIDLAEAQHSQLGRWRCWLTYFQGVRRAVCPSTQIVFVTNRSVALRELLLEYGFDRHLLSYYELRGPQGSSKLKEYVLSSGKFRNANREVKSLDNSGHTPNISNQIEA
jgi:hypothetical protein